MTKRSRTSAENFRDYALHVIDIVKISTKSKQLYHGFAMLTEVLQIIDSHGKKLSKTPRLKHYNT